METLQQAPDSERAIGAARKTTAVTLARTAATGAYAESDIAATIASWRRAGHRGSAARRPPRRQIRALYTLAAGSAA